MSRLLASFKNRGLYAILAILAVIGLGQHASDIFRGHYPDFVACLVYPSSYDDRIIYTGPIKVALIHDRGFVIENKDGFRISVHSKELPEINETIELKGKFKKDGHIELIELKRIKHWHQHRFIMFLASGIACLIFLVKFTSRFTFRAGSFLTSRDKNA